MNEEIIRTLIEEIDAFMTSNLPDTLFEMILRRLDSFGYVLTEEDAFGIAFSVQKSEINIMNDCNIEEVPEELYTTLCDMACGDFLSTKYRTGKLDLASLDLTGAIKSVQMGDASVTFGSTDEAKLEALISILSVSGRGNLECYRTLRW